MTYYDDEDDCRDDSLDYWTDNRIPPQTNTLSPQATAVIIASFVTLVIVGAILCAKLEMKRLEEERKKDKLSHRTEYYAARKLLCHSLIIDAVEKVEKDNEVIYLDENKNIVAKEIKDNNTVILIQYDKDKNEISESQIVYDDESKEPIKVVAAKRKLALRKISQDEMNSKE